ncbi:phage tail assembly chaperone [Pseudodesulfovibrio sp.]|uniref:phage tail assembly chaperone n=1 Tax=unclassified Pseudodesulfovibrio TaxID=2661612 RepID=UPI003AFF72E3
MLGYVNNYRVVKVYETDGDIPEMLRNLCVDVDGIEVGMWMHPDGTADYEVEPRAVQPKVLEIRDRQVWKANAALNSADTDEATKATLEEYKTALADIESLEGFPVEFVWPEVPVILADA